MSVILGVIGVIVVPLLLLKLTATCKPLLGCLAILGLVGWTLFAPVLLIILARLAFVG
jgi:hypothetical protein